MKNFLFENICLLSSKEKKARTIDFHPKKNLVTGRNHTGKSSLIKSLFLTIGARPQGKLARWDENTISVVTFKASGKRYKAVFKNGYRALFDDSSSLILATGSHREWSDAFAKAVGFNLVLTDKKLETVLADPKCFFLPFYINQDGSWQAGWDTFVGLQQYKSPSAAILEYFAGIKPPKFYELNSKKAQIQKALDELQKEYKLLGRTQERFSDKLSLAGPKIQTGNFELEITRLTTEVNILNEQQEKLRETSVREQEALHNINVQIELARETLSVYDNDSSYLQKGNQHQLECPTCGAHHAKSFLDVLTYADEARSLRELVIQLYDDAKKVSEKHIATQYKINELDQNYKKIEEILSAREGDLRFDDVVSGIGAENAFKVFEEERALIKRTIDEEVVKVSEINLDIKQLTDRSKSKEILTAFRNAYELSLIGLNLPSIDTDKLKLTSRPDLSGSGGPRSVLAYYAALWIVCRGLYASFSIPLVIDSPNQQGQDEINMPVVLGFIADNLPKDSQIILGSEVDTEHVYDNKIVLDKQYSLLLQEEYEAVKSLIDPLSDAMMAKLQADKFESVLRACLFAK